MAMSKTSSKTTCCSTPALPLSQAPLIIPVPIPLMDFICHYVSSILWRYPNLDLLIFLWGGQFLTPFISLMSLHIPNPIKAKIVYKASCLISDVACCVCSVYNKMCDISYVGMML